MEQPLTNGGFYDELLQKYAVKTGTSVRKLRFLKGTNQPVIQIQNREFILFCSNNFLNIAADPRLFEAFKKAFQQYGWGAGGPRLLSGTTDLHQHLEHHLSRFCNTESSTTFSSTYLANIGTIPSLVGKGDLILSDELNHASIVDGCRLSGAKVQVYPHLNLNILEDYLRKSKNSFRERIIITEGVHSMEGTLAPLPEIWQLATRYHALLYLDDSHGIGILGKKGQGTLEHYGLPQNHEKIIQVASLSKAIGCMGAAVFGTQKLKTLLLHKCRTSIFSTALSPAICCMVLKALEILKGEPWRINQLRQNCQRFAKGLKDFGQEGPPEREFIPIQPLMVEDDQKARDLEEFLFSRGIYARAISPPAVTPGTSRIRFTLMAEHKADHIDKVFQILKN